MKVQERYIAQFNLAIQFHYQGLSHGQILRRLRDASLDVVSPRTLSNWIAHFKSMDKEGISRDAPFELHLTSEYGLPIEASSYVSEMIFQLTNRGRMPFIDLDEWKPTFRQADWWWRVHNMAPDFSYQDVYVVATHYAIRELLEEIGGIPAEYSDLNGLMTYKPWASEQRTADYREAIEAKRFPRIDAVNYRTRGILDDDGKFSTGSNFGKVISDWGQMMGSKKYFTPFKALIMTLQVQLPSHPVPEELLNLVFEKEEVEAIKEHIKQNGKLE
ncbi:hypothetical protein OAJ44_00605 [Chloroflexi bacterium]|nr:hypothetical protein [Chloroflexota bacterium]